MTRTEFKNQFLINVKIRIHNREECYKFQQVAFEFGLKVHSAMNDEKQTPIAYNISDVIPEYKNESFATDMDNLCTYENGAIQKTAFYSLAKQKEIAFEDFIKEYNNLEN